jgi:hypothetical protein
MHPHTMSPVPKGRPASIRDVLCLSARALTTDSLAQGSETGSASQPAKLFRRYTGLSPAAWQRERLAALGTSDGASVTCHGDVCIRHWKGSRRQRGA